MRTKKEIVAMLKMGEEFVTKFPSSAFGDDNVENLDYFKRIIGMVEEGLEIDEIEEKFSGIPEDSSIGSHVRHCIDWLDGSEELY